MRFHIGDTPEWTYSPRPSTSQPLDPYPVSTAVEFTVTDPSGATSVYTQADPQVADVTNGLDRDWVLTLPALTAADVGWWQVYVRSTAGVFDGEDGGFLVVGRPAARDRPCERWPVVWPDQFNPTDYDQTMIDLALDAAQDLLADYSGGIYGVCTTTETYRMNAQGWSCFAPFKDHLGVWRNGSGGRECCRVRLAQQPVRRVVSVSVDGVLLAEGDYGVEGGYLRRRAGCWPYGADCDDPRLSVTYEFGRSIPTLGAFAMGEVANEYLRWFAGGECRLPRGGGITRQGVSASPVEQRRRRLGLPMADNFLDAVNPSNLTAPSRVVSPDGPRRVR